MQIGEAALTFLGQGIAVAGWTMFEDVRDIDILTAELDRFEDVGEQLSGFPNERFALLVLVVAWGFADEHQIGIGVSDAEDQVRVWKVGA